MKDFVIKNAVKAMGRKMDLAFMEALDKHCPDWDIDTVKERCRLVSYAGWEPGHEMLHLDGKPIAEIFPLKTRWDDQGKVLIERNYRIF